MQLNNYNFITLAEELKKEFIDNNELFFWRRGAIDIENAFNMINNIIDNKISAINEQEEKQELVDNRQAVALYLVSLCCDDPKIALFLF